MLAPLLLMISGIRKPPPISTASPLDTMTSFPFDMAARDTIKADALLFNTRAASDPDNCVRIGSIWELREPLLLFSISNSSVV